MTALEGGCLCQKRGDGVEGCAGGLGHRVSFGSRVSVEKRWNHEQNQPKRKYRCTVSVSGEGTQQLPCDGLAGWNPAGTEMR